MQVVEMVYKGHKVNIILDLQYWTKNYWNNVDMWLKTTNAYTINTGYQRSIKHYFKILTNLLNIMNIIFKDKLWTWEITFDI